MADSGSERFTVFVNYDDPRWGKFDSGHYDCHLHPDFAVAHFPSNDHGLAKVIMCYVTPDPANLTDARKALSEIKQLGLRRPDRAEAEMFFEQYPEEQNKFPIIALCGSIVGDGVDRRVAYISAHNDEFAVGEVKLGRDGFLKYRFLAVRKSV
ncbi:hypothetical protein HYT45_00430 [Candidatus Uhrbacteria bacterium]|nr:hypothetical protein [Candidatus Uhrbacteria bacterium]